jgi:Ca-activated chloride channel family protein
MKSLLLNPIEPAYATDVMRLSRPGAPAVGTRCNVIAHTIKSLLVIDRSGSMGGQKLAEAKRCAIELVHRMAPEDRVGMIQFDQMMLMS